MAVDTETKRRSALGMVIMALVVAPVPDGTIAAVDRAHIIGIYAGIAAASPGVETDYIHIFSDDAITPNHVTDNSKSVLIKDDLEVQGDIYGGGATSYFHTTSLGHVILPAGTATAGQAPLKFTSGTDLTIPEAGAIEYDGKHFSITEVVDRRVLSVASDSVTTAVTVTNTTDETTVFTASISADELHIGKVLRVWGAGQISTHDANDAITVKIKIGGTLLTTLDSTPKQVSGVAMHFWDVITIRTIGAAGTLASHGYIMIEDTEVHDNDQDVAIDTTGADDITVTFQWDDADAGNIAILDQCFLEVLV